MNKTISIVCLLLLALSCKTQKVYTEKDILGTYDVYISQYAGLKKTKLNYQSHFFADSLVVMETCLGAQKGKWYLDGERVLFYVSDSMKNLGKVNNFKIKDINTLEEKNTEMINSVDSTVSYVDFVYKKAKMAVPLDSLIKIEK